MIKHPVAAKARVIAAALAVNKCVAEFTSSANAPAGDGLKYCSESFDELSAACYELERWQDDVFLMRTKLDAIQAFTKEYAQPSRSFHIELELAIMRAILNKWENAG